MPFNALPEPMLARAEHRFGFFNASRFRVEIDRTGFASRANEDPWGCDSNYRTERGLG